MKVRGRNASRWPATGLRTGLAVAAGLWCLFFVSHTLNALRLSARSPKVQTGFAAYLNAQHADASLCGDLSATTVDRIMPVSMVYFRKRWNYTRTDWSLAIWWLKQKVSCDLSPLYNVPGTCNGFDCFGDWTAHIALCLPSHYIVQPLLLMIQPLSATVQEPTTTANICASTSQQTLQVLLYFGAYHHLNMTGLDGSPQGEQLQWHDLYVSLLLLGYHPVLLEKPRRLTSDFLDAFDIVIIDYLGILHGMDQAALAKHRCKLRVLDSWGTDTGPNLKSGWGFCCLKLPHLSQFWTFTPGYSPANSFLGYTVKSFRLLEEFESLPHRKMEVLLYGKDARFFDSDLFYINQLTAFAPTHATAMLWPNGVLPTVHNHGVLAPEDLHVLMQQTFVYAGFAAVMMGPASIEAMSQGMVFLNYEFSPPRNLSVLQGKPTTQLWTSQFPFLESQHPHVITINPKDAADVIGKLSEAKRIYEAWWLRGEYSKLEASALLGKYVFLGKTKGHRSGFVPVEYTSVGMLLRVHDLMQSKLC